jgi:hypothetical protein
MATWLGSRAWHCGNPECPEGGWHKALYEHDAATDTFTVDEYSDGKTEEIDEDEVPGQLALDASWLSYSIDVARTGADPLHAFPVPRTSPTAEWWEICVQPAPNGMANLLGARPFGAQTATAPLPLCVAESLGVIPDTGTLRTPWAQLQVAEPPLVANQWHPVQLMVQRDRPAEQVEHELKLAACDFIAQRRNAKA